jgi:hypothetical protein
MKRSIAALLLLGLSQSAFATDRVWFAPLPGIPGYTPLPGVTDYWNLFYDNAQWANSMNRVGVFEMIAQTLDCGSDAQLTNAFQFMGRHNMQFALSSGIVSGNCSEGSGGGSGAATQIHRALDHGATVNYYVFDEPFYFFYYPNSYNPCGKKFATPEALADEIGFQYLIFKEDPALTPIQIAEDEVFEDMDYPGLGSDFGRYLDRLKAWGVNIVAVHAEGEVEWASWQDSDSQIRPQLQSRGIKYGLIREGMNVGATTDGDWMSAAEWRINYYRSTLQMQQGRLEPDQNIFQSWDSHGIPDHAMPESDPTAFSYLINTMGVIGNIDIPAGGTSWTVAGVSGGWFLDQSANTDAGIDVIHVWDYGPSGNTFLGWTTPVPNSRPDVAAYYGSQFSGAGWGFIIPALGPGAHTVCFFPHSSVTGNFEWSQTKCKSFQN